jgi:predicted metal-binding protein
MTTHDKDNIVARQTPWRDIILVCRKCSRKLDGGFGPDGEDSLTRELKRGLRATGQRASCRVIETKCLGICPKGAVTVLAGRSPGAILIVPAGTDTLVALARLLPPA